MKRGCLTTSLKGFDMTKEQKRKLISDYMAKCPFIEFHEIVELNEETATIDISFDQEWKELPTPRNQTERIKMKLPPY